MKKLFIIVASCLISILSFAQEKDSDGRVVTRSGNQYKVTFNAVSDNGGTLSETWSGTIVNGKREGVWNFTGKYNKFEISSGVFRSGTVTMTRAYKGGLPHGSYILKHDLQLMNGAYNIFTDNWIYKAPQDFNEYISGAYAQGKPTGTWNINNEGLEKLTLMFKNGVMDGAFSEVDVITGVTRKGTFKDGYVLTMKEMLGADWGYETDYAGKDPSTLQPQETVSLNNMITRWGLYATGMNICNEYMTDYPAGSSDERVPEITYTLSDADTYRKLFGNVPEDVLASLEYQRQSKTNDRQDARFHEIDFQVDSLYRSHSDALPEDFKQFLSEFGLGHLYKTEYVYKTILTEHPEFMAFIEEVNNGTNNTLQYTLQNWWHTRYDESDNYSTRFGKLYAEALDEVKEHHGSEQDLDSALFIKIYPTKTVSHGIGRDEEPTVWDEFLQNLDTRYVEETFQLTEADLLHYLAWKYGDYTLVYNGVSPSVVFKLKSRDASSATKEELKEFALKYTDRDGMRHYEQCVVYEGGRMRITAITLLNNLKDKRPFKKLRETVPFEL